MAAEFEGFDSWDNNSDGFGDTSNGFGDSDSFGNSSNGFGDSNGFDNDSNGFGDSNGFSDESAEFGSMDGFDDTSSFGDDSSSSQSAFSDGNSSNFNPDTSNPQLKKTAIIGICVGLVALVAVLLVAGKVAKKSTSSNLENIPVENNTNNVVVEDKNVDNIMKDETNTSATNNNVVTNVVDSEFNWTVITDSENVSFSEEYNEMTFTVTSIKHYARAVDTNNNLVVKTTVSGSLSGLPGTYTIDVPYNKGIKLVVGNNFKVDVQLGTYNDKTVVGDIRY